MAEAGGGTVAPGQARPLRRIPRPWESGAAVDGDSTLVVASELTLGATAVVCQYAIAATPD